MPVPLSQCNGQQALIMPIVAGRLSCGINPYNPLQAFSPLTSVFKTPFRETLINGEARLSR